MSFPLLLIIMVPLVLMLVRWMMVHQRAETRARVHIRSYYAGRGAAEVAQRRMILKRSPWKAGETDTFNVHIDTGTIETVTVTAIEIP